MLTLSASFPFQKKSCEGLCELVLCTCVVQMHLNMSMNAHKGRHSCHEIVSGDGMRLTALMTATSDIVVI